MKFKTLSGRTDASEVAADYEGAKVFGKVRAGKTGVFFPDGLTVRYIPYSGLERVFKRINEVNGKLCCGNATFYYYRIVFVSGGKEIGDWITEDEKVIDAAIAAISEASPATQVGFVKA